MAKSSFPEFDAMVPQAIEIIDELVKALRLRTSDPDARIRFHGDSWSAVLTLNRDEA